MLDEFRAASSSMETRFLDIGDRLEESVSRVEKLTTTFNMLSVELAGDNLSQNTHGLLQVGASIASLAQAQNTEVAALDELAQVILAIATRITRIQKSVNGVEMLASGAKIAAAHILDKNLDFAGFSYQIGRTVETAKASLKYFDAELGAIINLLRPAISAQVTLGGLQACAIRDIPQRLERRVGAITTRGQHVSTVAALVAQGSKRIGQQIGDAVMALQIGDTVRQRIEHVEFAIELLAVFKAPATASHEATVELCCRLQSLQLDDTAAKLDHEVQKIERSLAGLADEAYDVLRLGTDAFSSTDKNHGTFFGELEGEVSEVSILLDGFQSARAEADQVIASVSNATARLVRQIGVMRSLETDIRIMGLNMTFKCDRLGADGRSLSVIAKELRLYATGIAVEADEVMIDLDKTRVIAATLSDLVCRDKQADIAACATIMTRSLSELRILGQSLTAAFRTLEHDGETVAELLLQGVRAQASSPAEIGQVLRHAASELRKNESGRNYEFAGASQEAEDMFEAIARSYTMESERTIMAHHFSGWSRMAEVLAAPTPVLAQSSAELEDILF